MFRVQPVCVSYQTNVSLSCRKCEICGESAKNVTGIEENTEVVVGWTEMRIIASARNSHSSDNDGSCWRRNHFCDFLLACLVLAFILPWFFSRN